MGNFSFISHNWDRAISNPWKQPTLCELQLLVDGEVVEKMRGVYSGYGTVLTDKPFRHYIKVDGVWCDRTLDTISRAPHFISSGEMWVSHTWYDIVYKLDFPIAAFHLSSLDEDVPEACNPSEDDPNQGN